MSYGVLTEARAERLLAAEVLVQVGLSAADEKSDEVKERGAKHRGKDETESKRGGEKEGVTRAQREARASSSAGQGSRAIRKVTEVCLLASGSHSDEHRRVALHRTQDSMKGSVPFDDRG